MCVSPIIYFMPWQQTFVCHSLININITEIWTTHTLTYLFFFVYKLAVCIKIRKTKNRKLNKCDWAPKECMYYTNLYRHTYIHMYAYMNTHSFLYLQLLQAKEKHLCIKCLLKLTFIKRRTSSQPTLNNNNKKYQANWKFYQNISTQKNEKMAQW